MEIECGEEEASSELGNSQGQQYGCFGELGLGKAGRG
jgi:hypothetical protein